MQISNLVNTNKTSFCKLTTGQDFFDTSVSLIQNKATRDSYVKAYNELQTASKDRNLEIRSLGDFGGVVVETDDMGKVTKYISKNFENAIECLKEATLKLTKTDNQDKKPRRKPFQGNI